MRASIQDFSLANPIYAGATVSFYTVSAGAKTSTLATLYSATTGTGTLANPQAMDSDGKFAAPVYIGEPVVATVSGLSIADHDTGIITVYGTWRGDWATSTAYQQGDQVRDAATKNIYVASVAHTSGVLATDISAGRLLLEINVADVEAARVAAELAEDNAAASESAAAGSASTATTQAGIATTQAGLAATAKTNAETAEVNAELAEANATTQAGIATTQAGLAATAKTNAETAEVNAELAEANAETAQAAAESAASAVAIPWAFDASTTMADPGTGEFRLNNAAVGSTTAIAVSALSADTGNPDVSDYIVTWDDSTNTVKGHLVLKKRGTPATFAVFSITSVTDNTTWLQLAVTHIASNGAWSAADVGYFQATRAGDKGTDGVGAGDFMADGTVPMTGSLTLSGAGTGIVFEGTTADVNETTLVAGEPTADRIITLPNATTTLAGLDDIQSQTGKAYTTGGTSTAYTLTPIPAIAANAENQEFDIEFHTAAGATPTITISGKAALLLKYRDSTGAKQAVTSTQIPSGWRSKVTNDGTDFIVREVPVVAPTGGITLATPVATTSGTSIDFTGLPAGTKRITVGLAGVSTSGTSGLLLRFGTAGGIQTSTYNGRTYGGQTAINGAADWTNGVELQHGAITAAADILRGSVTFTLLDPANNIWSVSGSDVRTGGATSGSVLMGTVTLSGSVTTLRLTTAGGSDTFDAGSMNIAYE